MFSVHSISVLLSVFICCCLCLCAFIIAVPSLCALMLYCASRPVSGCINATLFIVTSLIVFVLIFVVVVPTAMLFSLVFHSILN